MAVNPVPPDANAAIRGLHDLWLSKCESGRIPSGEEMGIDELFRKDPRHGLIGIENDGKRKRFRIVRQSSLHQNHVGRAVENIPLDEIVTPEIWPHVERVYLQIIRERRPHYWLRTGAYIGGTVTTYERLLVPLAGDEETVESILGLWIRLDDRHWGRDNAPPQVV